MVKGRPPICPHCGDYIAGQQGHTCPEMVAHVKPFAQEKWRVRALAAEARLEEIEANGEP